MIPPFRHATRPGKQMLNSPFTCIVLFTDFQSCETSKSDHANTIALSLGSEGQEIKRAAKTSIIRDPIRIHFNLQVIYDGTERKSVRVQFQGLCFQRERKRVTCCRFIQEAI